MSFFRFVSGPKRNFQILSPLDFLAEFTQHIPPQGVHLIRYYGWYSNKTRGMRKKAAAKPCSRPPSAGDASGAAAAAHSSKTWAMLIKRVYEMDPLACPHCGSEMKVVAFIDPPQREVMEKILGHCGLWRARAPRAPPDGDGLVHDVASYSRDRQTGSSGQAGELTYVDVDMLLANF